MLGEVRLALGGADDQRIRPEMVVHEGAQALAQGPGQLEQDAQGGVGLALLHRRHQGGVDPGVHRQLHLGQAQPFPVGVDAFTEGLGLGHGIS